MLSTVLVNPKEEEYLALSLNGKKKQLKRRDFESAFDSMKLTTRQQYIIFGKMAKARNKWIEFIQKNTKSS